MSSLQGLRIRRLGKEELQFIKFFYCESCLYGNFNKPGTVKRLFRFHYLKPSFNGFFDISNGLFIRLPLRKASRKCRNFSNIVDSLILFDYHMQFHIISLSRLQTYKKLAIRKILVSNLRKVRQENGG